MLLNTELIEELELINKRLAERYQFTETRWDIIDIIYKNTDDNEMEYDMLKDDLIYLVFEEWDKFNPQAMNSNNDYYNIFENVKTRWEKRKTFDFTVKKITAENITKNVVETLKASDEYKYIENKLDFKKQLEKELFNLEFNSFTKSNTL